MPAVRIPQGSLQSFVSLWHLCRAARHGLLITELQRGAGSDIQVPQLRGAVFYRLLLTYRKRSSKGGSQPTSRRLKGRSVGGTNTGLLKRDYTSTDSHGSFQVSPPPLRPKQPCQQPRVSAKFFNLYNTPIGLMSPIAFSSGHSSWVCPAGLQDRHGWHAHKLWQCPCQDTGCDSRTKITCGGG